MTWLACYQASDLALHPLRLLEAGGKTFMFFQNGPTFKMTADGGTTWQDGTLPIGYNNQEISISERNDTLFVQGSNALAFSANGGQTWAGLPAPGLPAPVRACLFPPSGAIVAFTDVGIFRAEQPGAAFVQSAGFSSHNVSTALPDGDGSWWLGTSLGLFFSPDNGSSWQKMLEGFGSPPIHWVRRAGPNVLVGNGTEFFHSPDGGQTWKKRSLPASALADVEVLGNQVFIADCLKAWRSKNWGAAWEQFAPAANGLSGCIRVWQKRDSLLAVAAQWSEVFLSRDTGATWQDFSPGLGGLPYISFDLGISPAHLYAVSGYRLMRSPLATPAWTEIELPLNVTAADGPLPRYFHFAGDTIRAGIPAAGIFRSADGGQVWAAWAPTELYRRANSFHFEDLLTVMSINGGVWYVGNLPGLPKFGGRVFVDVNENHLFDVGDTPLSGHLVQLKNQQSLVATAANGRYAFDWRDQSDSLHLRLFTDGATAMPTAHFDSGPANNLDFAVSPIAIGTDLAAELAAASVPRPGFAFNLHLTCRNDGYLPADGRVFLAKDPSLAWLGFSETPAQLLGDTVRWLLPNIPPGGFATYRATLQVDANTPLGALLYFSAKAVSDNVLDLDGSNNVALTVLQVVGSLDPNDKSVVPGGAITPAMVADSQRLAYTVRFQNTGTYPAEFVRITDTLSPQFDLASLRVLAASHPCQWSLRERVVEFFFPDIQLPDSTSNEPGSHGFVKFNLRVRPGLQNGDAVENFADIFFDFNPPVRTNTVRTLVDEMSGSAMPAATPPLVCRIAPNPVGDVMSVLWENPTSGPKAAYLEIFDQNGRSLQAMAQAISPANIPVHDLPPGSYWLKIRSGGREIWALWVKI